MRTSWRFQCDFSVFGRFDNPFSDSPSAYPCHSPKFFFSFFLSQGGWRNPTGRTERYQKKISLQLPRTTRVRLLRLRWLKNSITCDSQKCWWSIQNSSMPCDLILFPSSTERGHFSWWGVGSGDLRVSQGGHPPPPNLIVRNPPPGGGFLLGGFQTKNLDTLLKSSSVLTFK